MISAALSAVRQHRDRLRTDGRGRSPGRSRGCARDRRQDVASPGLAASAHDLARLAGQDRMAAPAAAQRRARRSARPSPTGARRARPRKPPTDPRSRATANHPADGCVRRGGSSAPGGRAATSKALVDAHPAHPPPRRRRVPPAEHSVSPSSDKRIGSGEHETERGEVPRQARDDHAELAPLPSPDQTPEQTVPAFGQEYERAGLGQAGSEGSGAACRTRIWQGGDAAERPISWFRTMRNPAIPKLPANN